MRDAILLYDKKISYKGENYQIKDFCLIKNTLYIKLYNGQMYVNVLLKNIIPLIK